MGEVYRARDARLRRDVAIKVLLELPRARRPLRSAIADNCSLTQAYTSTILRSPGALYAEPVISFGLIDPGDSVTFRALCVRRTIHSRQRSEPCRES
jgi:hypothetical protein